MDSDNPNHIVLCAEKNTNGNANSVNSCQFKTLWTNGDGGDWSVEAGEYSDAVKDSLNRCIQFVITSSDEEFKSSIGEYFDLYSLLDYYSFSYLCCHLDGLAKNMLLVTYDGKIWGASLYDMDSIFGAYYTGGAFVSAEYKCPEQYQEQFSLLWQRIENCFGKELYARYMELREGALSLGNIITHVEEIYDLIPDRVFNDDRAKWTGLPAQNTNTITRFRNYMRDRVVYVDGKFKEFNIERIPCTGISLPNNSLTFTDNNSKTLIATVIPNNTTDLLSWNVSPSGIVTVNNGVVTPIKNGDCTITATCGGYSATCGVNVNIEVEEEEINIVTDGLIRYYDFSEYSNNDKNTHVLDKASSNIPIILNNFKYNETSGFNNGLLKISSNSDYAKCEDFPLDANKDWTLEIVASYPSITNSIDVQTLAFGEWENGRWAYGFGGYNMTFRNYKYSSDNQINIRIESHDIDGNLNSSTAPNNIRHIIYSYNSSLNTITRYMEGTVDGVKGIHSSTTTILDKLASPTKLYLGLKADNNTYASANFGVIRLYDKCLSLEDIKVNIEFEKRINRG